MYNVQANSITLFGRRPNIKTNNTFLNSLRKNEVEAGRCSSQPAKKVVSDSPGLVDLAIGLVNSVLNLPDGQVK